MEFDAVEMLRERHPAWRLLRAQNASLVLSLLGRHFVEGNSGATAEQSLVGALDEHLHLLNAGAAEPRFPRSPKEYLDSWAAPEAGWLRRFYPHGSDDVHYDATPAFEKAYSWVTTLRARSFVGTESRLHTVVGLLRQIVHGTETDVASRLARPPGASARRSTRRIREAEEGSFAVIERHGRARPLPAVRGHRPGAAVGLPRGGGQLPTARSGRSRADRCVGRAAKASCWPTWWPAAPTSAAPTRAAASRRSTTSCSPRARQDELSELLNRVQPLVQTDADVRLRTIHHDWSEAAERTQQTVRQISEQLRRFLDDQVWLENRRVLDIVRVVEARARLSRPTTGSGTRRRRARSADRSAVRASALRARSPPRAWRACSTRPTRRRST